MSLFCFDRGRQTVDIFFKAKPRHKFRRSKRFPHTHDRNLLFFRFTKKLLREMKVWKNLFSRRFLKKRFGPCFCLIADERRSVNNYPTNLQVCQQIHVCWLHAKNVSATRATIKLHFENDVVEKKGPKRRIFVSRSILRHWTFLLRAADRIKGWFLAANSFCCSITKELLQQQQQQRALCIKVFDFRCNHRHHHGRWCI